MKVAVITTGPGRNEPHRDRVDELLFRKPVMLMHDPFA